jgi:AAA15 family ATPase/GTPase
MRVKTLHVTNFRGLEEVSVEFEKDTSVIVGPNAIGKTTLFEAIRLLKSVLAPRYPQENQQTLQALGALPVKRQMRSRSSMGLHVS